MNRSLKIRTTAIFVQKVTGFNFYMILMPLSGIDVSSAKNPINCDISVIPAISMRVYIVLKIL